MKVSKEIVKKAEEYEKLKNRIDMLYEELEEWANENGFEDFWIDGFGVSHEPEGEEQWNDEHCDQHMSGEDCGGGKYYFPIENSTEYMWIEYSF